MGGGGGMRWLVIGFIIGWDKISAIICLKDV